MNSKTIYVCLFDNDLFQVRQRAASMSQMPYRRPTSNSVTTQDGSNWGSGNSNFSSQQNQIRQRASSMTSAFPSRSHSATSSNLSSAYSSPLARRYSSASSDTISEPGTGDGTDMRNSYYQVNIDDKSISHF